MNDLTPSLGRFAANFQDIPETALRVANAGVTDAVGVQFAGRNEAPVRALQAVLLRGSDIASSSGPASSVLLGAQRARSDDAAFINAAATHVLAMDDVAAGCHPSALLLPALLAEGEVLGCSGAELLRAYVVGYEILAELASRDPDPLHATGWHPSTVLGPPAVAGAVARLLGLDAQAATHAIAMAASLTGGLIANFGTGTKAIQLARASAAGVLAARLAQQGVTASPDALERPGAGLLAVVSPQRRVRLEGGFEPTSLRILEAGLCLKQYPVCYSTHRVVNAAAEVGQQPGFDPLAVRKVTVHIGDTQAALARHHEVRTPLQAKYSVEFAAASGLVAGDAGFTQLEPAFFLSEPVQQLIARTSLVLRTDRSEDDPSFCSADRVVVEMADGRVLDSDEVAYALGHARRPLDAQTARRKFMACAASGGAQAVAQRLHELLCDLPALADVREVARVASGG